MICANLHTFRNQPRPCRMTLSMPVLRSSEKFSTLSPSYASGFWSVIICFFLSTIPAHAEWVAVDAPHLLPGLQTVYIDPDTIRREENLVAIWQLIDFRWMQGNPRGTPRFLSTKTHKQFDCTEKRLRLLAFTEFSRPM